MELELQLTPEDEAFRAEVRKFLDDNLPKDWDKNGKPWKTPQERIDYLRIWQRKLNKAGLLAPAWPKEAGGRNASLTQQILYSQEMAKQSTPEVLNRNAILQVGPAIIQWCRQEQKDFYLPRILNCDDIWCQGFSEPGGGSDLAAMTTKAEDKGDHWLVNGSKIWTSRGEISNRCMLLARTNSEVAKHQGITALILDDMKAPGITVRPLKQISGAFGFNQVFYDNVVVPKDHTIGPVNGGWKVITDTLRFERAGTATSRAERRFQILMGLAKTTKIDGKRRLDDAATREKIVRYSCQVQAMKEIGWRGMNMLLKGIPPGPETSVAKLLWSENDQSMAEFEMEMLGPYGPLQAESPLVIKRGNPGLGYLIMRAATIGGGTSEIQRNIIGERILGLPKD